MVSDSSNPIRNKTKLASELFYESEIIHVFDKNMGSLNLCELLHFCSPEQILVGEKGKQKVFVFKKRGVFVLWRTESSRKKWTTVSKFEKSIHEPKAFTWKVIKKKLQRPKELTSPPEGRINPLG